MRDLRFLSPSKAQLLSRPIPVHKRQQVEDVEERDVHAEQDAQVKESRHRDEYDPGPLPKEDHDETEIESHRCERDRETDIGMRREHQPRPMEYGYLVLFVENQQPPPQVLCVDPVPTHAEELLISGK